MSQLFKDPELQQQFEKDGLITVQLLDAEEVADLAAFYKEATRGTLSGFHASMFHADIPYRKAVDSRIKQALADKLPNILPGYRPLYANFMVKEPGPESEMKVHQDWTYVDEDQYTSLAIWFPLMDLTHETGALYFIKGSHRIVNTVRGPGTICPYEHIQELVREKYLTQIPLKAGEAVIWHHRLVHYSPANMGTVPRVACTAILVPEAAPVYHFHRMEDAPYDEAEQYEVDTDFYMNYQLGVPPQNVKHIGKVHYEVFHVTDEQLASLQPKTQPVGLMNRLKKIFA